MVYISCNPYRAQRNWIELGRPESKQYKGEPFFPTTAVAVDMFPHTSHTEMIILFERKSSEEKPKSNQEDKKEIEDKEKASEEKPTEAMNVDANEDKQKKE